MPELPEVETIVRGLRPRLEGLRIEHVEIVAALVVKAPIGEVQGQTIQTIRRLGKNIVMECTNGVLSVHLGMTGRLLIGSTRNAYTRVIFRLSDLLLFFDDVRQFGRLHYAERLPTHLAALGPDALQIAEPELFSRIKRSNGRVKPLLLNQRVLAGLGNIYVDEALFRAGIHPNASASNISRPRLSRLLTAVQETLHEAIRYGGSSISDYVDSNGREGSFQDRHMVYAREGAPCKQCGAPIVRIVVAQRGTHFCPKCQKP